MKKYLFLMVMFPALYILPQVDARVSMGLYYLESKSFYDYLNLYYNSYDEEIGPFEAVISFSGEVDFNLSQNYQAGIELDYQFNSFTFNNIGFNQNIDINLISPSAIFYYVIRGQGYNFKFGGGAGVRFFNITEDLMIRSVSTSSTGFGVLAKVDANTALSTNLYANIGGDLRYNFIPDMTAAGNNSFNYNSFAAGIRLGITYSF